LSFDEKKIKDLDFLFRNFSYGARLIISQGLKRKRRLLKIL